MEQSKACFRCKQIKQLENFNKKASGKYGRDSRCRDCCREIDKARYPARRESRLEYFSTWRAENQDHIKQYRQDYYAENCEVIRAKAMDWYFANIEQAKTSRKRYAIENADYLAKMALEWQRANPEKVAANNKKYKDAHPEKAREYEARRRALMYENGVFFIYRKEIGRLYSSACFYCEATEKIEADHVLPVKRTGCHGISNLVPACRSCNASKGEKTIMEWRVWKQKNRV